MFFYHFHRSFCCRRGSFLFFCLFLQFCNKPMEPIPVAGFDIQRHLSESSSQSLYTNEENRDFAIINDGRRKTVRLTSEEISTLRHLLAPKYYSDYHEDSRLGEKQIPFPTVTIRRRSGMNLPDQEFFVLLGPDPGNPQSKKLLAFVNDLFRKYGE